MTETGAGKAGRATCVRPANSIPEGGFKLKKPMKYFYYKATKTRILAILNTMPTDLKLAYSECEFLRVSLRVKTLKRRNKLLIKHKIIAKV